MNADLTELSEQDRALLPEVQPELILNTYWGFAGTQALSVAVELDLFSLIHSQVNTLEKIVRHLKLPIRPLRNLLDALVGLGFLTKSKLSYRLSSEAKIYLVKTEPHYLGSILSRANQNLQLWGQLGEVVKSGRPLAPPDDDPFRTKFFIELARDIFPTSYASAIVIAKKLGMGKSLSGLKILDLASGSGAWSIPLALADSTSRVIAQDLPEVLNLTRQYIRRFRLENQYDYLPGDLSQIDLGKGQYDLIILGHICHSIGEAETRKLIKRIYEALKNGGRLLIAEFIPNDLRTGDKIPLLFSLQMLLDTSHGDVFTLKELKRWLLLSGFKKMNALKAVYPTTVVMGIK